MAKLIKTDGTVTVIHPHNGKFFELTELQKLVGGIIECAPTVDDKLIMVCHEEAKLYNEPINEKATALYKYGWSSVIAGTVVVGDREEICLDC